MKRDNLHIKKDFMGLVAGDEVQLLFADNYNEIHFDVINRTVLKRFHGNKKGKWNSTDNFFPHWKKNAKAFILKEEVLNRFTALVFNLKDAVRDHHKTKDLHWSDFHRGRRIPDDQPFFDFQVDRILEDLRSVGVID